LVPFVPCTDDPSVKLQLFEQWSQCAGIQKQPAAQLLHAQPVDLPQDQHRNILGVRQSELFSKRMIKLRHFFGA
jgi:hypothetical protein